MFVIAKATSAAFESLKLHKTDLRYLTVISAIAAIPVVVLRCLPLSCAVCRQACLWLPLAGELVVLWMWRRAWLANEIQATQELQAEVPRGAWAAARPALVAACFVGLAIVNFYLPLRQQFWGGGDEHVVFMSWSESLFSHGMDQMVGRPFEEFQVWMSEILTPNRIEGFLYVATAVNLLNALLVMGILAQFFRDDWLIPLIGGAMYLVNPCDDLRFYIIWGANCYTISLFFCLLASWLSWSLARAAAGSC